MFCFVLFCFLREVRIRGIWLVHSFHISPQVTDLANADASEEDKLKAMMKQSGEDWDPSQ